MKVTIERCYELKRIVPERYFTNRGGYQSEDIDLITVFPELFNGIKPHLDEVMSEIGPKLFLDNAWLNINKYGDYNEVHVHPYSVLSMVFYIKTNENTGNINFYNPAEVDAFGITGSYDGAYSIFSIIPNVGDLIIFPSYLRHFVEPNKSEEERISISANFKRL